ncbi:MAG: toxin-antitoxin system YwqK family antitoxin [Bacteroidota bacterium]
MINRIFLFALTMTMATGCWDTGNDKKQPDEGKADDGVQVVKYYNEGRLAKEVTFKDSIRNGLCSNYYEDGRLKRTIWYEDGLKEDTAKWYYREGMVYRATPYKNDKIHGVQTKYYKSGRVQATLPYKNGLRTQGLKEYLPDGREVDSYPSIEYRIRDLTDTQANAVRVFTRLSNESANVRFYRGSFVNGTFDPEKCKDITTSSGMGFVELKPDNEKGKGYVDIIAVYITRFRNKKILNKRIELPYNNLY